jgi:hypothetical protein
MGLKCRFGNPLPVTNYHPFLRNARTSPGVFLVFFCNGIDVIKKLHLCPFGWHRCNFLIKKITSMPFQENTRRIQGDALAFLIIISVCMRIYN